MSLIDSIIGAESGGDPNAKNPNSSAAGPGQFIDSTFLDVIKKTRPDLAGLPDDQILALKTDPQVARQATEAYAQQNQAILSKAGVPVTDGTTYLAHFAGPQGAVKILQADPNTPVGDVLGPAVVKANPFLAGMTAQGLQAWAAKKMGTTAPTAQAAAPQATPTPANAQSGAPMQIAPQTAAPIFPAQQQQAAPQGAAPSFAQIPDPQAPPIFYAPRRPINLAALQSAFRPPVFPRNS